MDYKLISHRVNGFGDGQLRQFEQQVKRALDGENAEALGGVEVTELPNGYQLTQAVVKKDEKGDGYKTGTSRNRRGG